MNITLIGMPGSGKSFIGAKLAKKLGYAFVDPDNVLEAQYDMSLRQVLASLGEDAFLRAEAETSVATLARADRTILATGGSIVYSDKAMQELAHLSTIVYLVVDLETLEERIGTTPRGIVGMKNKTFPQLFEERAQRYEAAASFRVDGTQPSEKIVDAIVNYITGAS